MKRTRDYRLIEAIVWADEYLVNGQDKHCKLTQSYGSYGKAFDAAYAGEKNPAIEHKTCTIIYKPTGETLNIIIVK